MGKGGIKSLSRAQLEERLRLVLRRRVMDGWFGLGYAAVKYGCIAACAYFGWRSVNDLAGKLTVADIGFRFDVAISYAVAVGATALTLRQRKLRRDTVERLQSRITELERVTDKKRSSSGLTKRGETRQEDA